MQYLNMYTTVQKFGGLFWKKPLLLTKAEFIWSKQ